MIFNDYHKHFFRAGGNSTIHHKYVMIELKNGCKYIFHPKDINLSDLILNHKEYSFLQVNQIDSIYRVHTYGTKCKDNHDLQSFCVVRLGTGYYGFPMFTDTALHCSRLIRKQIGHYDELHYASLLKGKQPDNKYIKHIKDTYLPLSRWIRIARMKNGMTAIMEMINNDWFPASYLFDKHAELLKVNLHINQNDLVNEGIEEGIRFQEWNLSPESFQSILQLSPFLLIASYED